MMSDILLALTGLVAVLSLYLLWHVAGRRRAAIEYDGHIRWVREQLERAEAQINSSDVVEILAGFQTLAMINDPSIRLRCLARITQLIEHDNQVVANHAKMTYDKILEELGEVGKT